MRPNESKPNTRVKEERLMEAKFDHKWCVKCNKVTEHIYDPLYKKWFCIAPGCIKSQPS